MAKHSTIYPSSHDLEAVQSLVSTVECALKQVSDWLDRSNSNGVGTVTAISPAEPGAKQDKDPGDKDQGDKDTGDEHGEKPADEEEEDADGYRYNTRQHGNGGPESGSLEGVLRVTSIQR
jgi:hypothetical protein